MRAEHDVRHDKSRQQQEAVPQCCVWTLAEIELDVSDIYRFGTMLQMCKLPPNILQLKLENTKSNPSHQHLFLEEILSSHLLHSSISSS